MMSYWYVAKVDVCDKCGRAEEEVQLAKSSVGWKPCVKPEEEYFTNWEEFKEFVRRDDVEIYRRDTDNQESAEELIEFIESASQSDDLKTHDPEVRIEETEDSMSRKMLRRDIEEDRFEVHQGVEFLAGSWE